MRLDICYRKHMLSLPETDGRFCPAAGSVVAATIAMVAQGDKGPRRCAAVMVSAMGRGELSAQSISVAEQVVLVDWAEAKRRALQAKLVKTASEGSTRKARSAIRLYRESLAVRFLALWETTPEELRPSRLCGERDGEERRVARLAWVLGNVGGLCGYQSAPAGRLMTRPKGDGRYRAFFSFERLDKARFRLLSDALEPFVGFHASQFQLRWHAGGRGTQAACKSLLETLSGLSSTSTAEASDTGRVRAEDHVFFELDVTDFFGSISEAWWATKPILDEETSRLLYTRHLHVKSSGKVRDQLEGAYQEVIRRGLPQGSALSALVAEWVMADVLKEVPALPTGVHLFTYCDNIGVLAPRSLADATEELIRSAFSASGAGSFSLKRKTGPTLVTSPFRFLGMEFVVLGAKVGVRVPCHAVDLATLAIRTDLLHAATPADLARLRRKVVGKAAAWRLWSGASAWKEERLREIDDASEWLSSPLDQHSPS